MRYDPWQAAVVTPIDSRESCRALAKLKAFDPTTILLNSLSHRTLTIVSDRQRVIVGIVIIIKWLFAAHLIHLEKVLTEYWLRDGSVRYLPFDLKVLIVNIPPYAILSHAWEEEEEVLHQDVMGEGTFTTTASSKQGFRN